MYCISDDSICYKWIPLRIFLRHGLKHHTITMTMHIVQSLLHVLQVGTAYILMLIAMTFNVWLFLAVAFGSGIGYFIFSRVRHLSSPFRESNDHCHWSYYIVYIVQLIWTDWINNSLLPLYLCATYNLLLEHMLLYLCATLIIILNIQYTPSHLHSAVEMAFNSLCIQITYIGLTCIPGSKDSS